MSFILDALKKSESDRQQQATPGIASVPVGRAAGGTPRWLPFVLVLLAVNLAAVVFLLFRPAPEPAAIAALAPSTVERNAAPAGNTATPPASPPRDPSPADTGGRASTPAASTSPEPLADQPREGRPAANSEPAFTERAPERNPAPGTRQPAATADESGYIDDPFLTLDELRASGAVNLPDMHIDLHVYSDNPAERFVFINMNQYRENSTLDDGPLVRRITPEGVILEYRGTTFLVPRD